MQEQPVILIQAFLVITIGFSYLGFMIVGHDNPKLLMYVGFGGILASVITGTVFTLISIKESLDENNRLLLHLPYVTRFTERDSKKG